MTDTYNITVPSVDELKRTVLPGLFIDARAISHYGDSAVSSDAMDRYSSMMEKNAVTESARTLSGTYKAGTSVTVIPDNIRYALEMAAFSKAVAPAAVSYEDNRNDLARHYSGFGKSSFFTGGILTLIGVLILTWVRRLNQRVQFLNNYAIR